MGRQLFPWLKKMHSRGDSLKAHVDGCSSSRSSSSSADKNGSSRSSSSMEEKQIAATYSLIEKHLSNRKEQTPWDQEFSSMSSCRSEGDSKVLPRQIALKNQEEDEFIPPLLRNPHVAQFDIVDFDESEEVEEEDEEEAAAAAAAAEELLPEAVAAEEAAGYSSVGETEFEANIEAEIDPDIEEELELEGAGGSARSGTCPSPSRNRRKCNDSFSASLPSEIQGVVAESIPLVKYSFEPYLDFRASMRDMIQQKELFEWADLEELLYCYLSLNSPEHHEVIKQSFADVWYELGLPPPNESPSFSHEDHWHR